MVTMIKIIIVQKVAIVIKVTTITITVEIIDSSNAMQL